MKGRLIGLASLGGASIILTIIMIIVGISSGGFSFSFIIGMSGVGVVLWIIYIAALVLGIVTLAMPKSSSVSGMAIASGILGILIWIPFVSIALTIVAGLAASKA